MIVHRVWVENWRCFIDSIEVGPFTDRINVLHAPNATGKTTLFTALLRGLLDGHKVKGQSVEELRPWGRALPPAVTVEFSHSEARYRVRKQFLDSPASTLERFEENRFVRLAEGDAADRETRNMISKNPPSKGLSKQQNWGIAQVLWVPQGELGYKELTGDLVEDIRASLGAQFSSAGDGPHQKRIEELYQQYFTSGGKLKTGKAAPELAILREELERTKVCLIESVRAQTEFEEAARLVEDLRARRAQARREAESISVRLQGAREQARVYRSLLAEKETQQEKTKTAEAQYQAFSDRIENLSHARISVEDFEKKILRLREEIPQREKEVQAHETDAAAAKANLEDIRNARKKVDLASERAERARAYTETEESLRRLNTTLEQIAQLKESLNDYRIEGAKILAPDATKLREIRETLRKIDEMKVRIEASLMHLELVPEEDCRIQVLEGEETGEKNLVADVPHEAKGSPEVVVHIDGFGRIRSRGPIGSVEDFRVEKSKAEKVLSDLTQPFGTSKLHDLEQLAEIKDQAEKKIAEQKAKLSALLSGKSFDSLQEERNRLEAILKNILKTESAWNKKPPNAESLREQAVETKRDFIQQVEAAEAERDSKQTALAAASSQKNSLSEKFDEAEKQIFALKSRLEELSKDGLSDEERDKQKREAALSWEAAKEKLSQTDEALGQFEGNPVDLMEKLEQQIQTADQAATLALEKEKEHEGRLQQLSAAGTYTTLAETEEKVSDLERRVDEETLRMGAIRLLHNTMREHHNEAMDAVLKPVASLSSRHLERIAGTRFGKLKLGETFEPQALIPKVLDTEIPLEHLSGGETEQVYLATRLALAETLAKEQRQMVVLDDILTATDTGRLARIMTLLEEAADRLQILILTCHPERYGGLKDANFIDLEECVAKGREG